jgi:DNA-directed RNA polymerase specialized sigma24 family protein
MLASRGEADEVVRQTFLGTVEWIRKAGHSVELRPSLYTLAYMHCMNILWRRGTGGSSFARRRKREPPGLQERLDRYAHLSHDQRAALLLAEVGGLSRAEIATVLGTDRRKVSALISGASALVLAA